MTKTYINSIGTATPAHKVTQMQAAEFMADAAQLNREERRKLMVLYRASGIEQRYSVLPDYGRALGDYTFYPNTPSLEPFPSVSARMQQYREAALPMAVEAFENCFSNVPEFDKKNVTHLITISCTGMYAPGLDIELIERLGLQSNVERTAINFMGCYAAFNGLKAANNICKADPEAKVLMICLEICSLHFQKSKTDDQILSNALFGDGAAALLLSSRKLTDISLRIDKFHCDLAPEGKGDMAWNIADFGFEMTLTSYIPQLIKGGIKQLATRLLDSLQLTIQDIAYFAIHPGGRRILEVIEQELGMTKQDNYHAYNTLRQYGNMSSATVLFVLLSLYNSLDSDDHGKNILSFAFGPGLTMESMLLTVEV